MEWQNECLPLSQCGAVSFIENVRAENLKIDEREFDVKMGFVDGKTDLDLFLEEGAVEEEEDLERIMILEVCSSHTHTITALTPSHPPPSPVWRG